MNAFGTSSAKLRMEHHVESKAVQCIMGWVSESTQSFSGLMQACSGCLASVVFK